MTDRNDHPEPGRYTHCLGCGGHTLVENDDDAHCHDCRERYQYDLNVQLLDVQVCPTSASDDAHHNHRLGVHLVPVSLVPEETDHD